MELAKLWSIGMKGTAETGFGSIELVRVGRPSLKLTSCPSAGSGPSDIRGNYSVLVRRYLKGYQQIITVLYCTQKTPCCIPSSDQKSISNPDGEALIRTIAVLVITSY